MSGLAPRARIIRVIQIAGSVPGQRHSMKSKLGHYDVVSELGRGGMGVVLKGFEPALNRHVAIKVLSEALAHDPSVVERFSREARAMAALNDPHIIQVYFIGEDQGQPFFVMEYVEGETLSALIKREHRLTPERAREILLQAASGLATAHDMGVIHRDIKPGNLMLNARGMVKVADFGIALATKDLSKKLTSTGEFVGTPGYLSPEVCLGKVVDERSDIFSLGIVFFEMLTGKMPFTDESPLGLMLEVVRAEVPDVRQLNGSVDDNTYSILKRMIAKNPDERFPNCHELVDALKLAGTMSPSTVNSRAAMAVPPVAPAGATAAWSTPVPQALQPPTLNPSRQTALPQPSVQTALRNTPAPPTLPRFATDAPPMLGAVEVKVTQAAPRKSALLAVTALAASVLALLGAGAWGYSQGYFGGGTPPPAVAAASAQSGSAKPFTGAALAAAAGSAQAGTSEFNASAQNSAQPETLGAAIPMPASAAATAAIEPKPATPNEDARAIAAELAALKADIAKMQAAQTATQSAAANPPAPARPALSRDSDVLDKRVAIRESRPPISAGPPRIFVMSAGDPTLAQPAEQAIEAALINAGLPIADESFQSGIGGLLRSGGGDLPGKLAQALNARPKDILILVRAVPQGSQNITFYGQSSTLNSANLTVQGYLLNERRPFSGARTVRVNFTSLNAAQQAEIAVKDMLPQLVSTVKRNRG